MDSIAWVIASMPVAAVSFGGRLSVIRGSRIATFGSRSPPWYISFRCRASSVTIATWVDSEPVPAVVGMAMWGSMGAVSYTHLRAHETRHDLVCRLLLEK